MDNLFQGYNKVVDHDQPPKTSTKPSRKPFIAITILSMILIFTILETLTNETDTESLPQTQPQPLSQDSIKAVCSLTRYPNSCLTSISNHTGSDPRTIFALFLKLSLVEVKKLVPLPEALISKANDKGTESALKDCVSLFDDAVSQLTESVRVTNGVLTDGGQTSNPHKHLLVPFTDEKVGDLKTWISASMSDEETCVDGLEEMGSTVVGEVKANMQKSKEYMSNTLAILSNVNVLLEKFRLNSLH